ncbi:MAG: OmpA family protein [Chitinispirillaceae bacterium]|nr:OmpA family protein [Chitinispirillaceae bacterium]
MKKVIITTLVCSLTLVSCAHWRALVGGSIGAGAGGAIGGVIGKRAGNTAAGAIIGAAIGGTAGAAIGAYMDKQAAEIRRDIRDANVERIGEGIKITFNSGILFDINSDALKPVAKQNIEQLAIVLNKYKDTEILIEGHTDSTGSESLNLKLSDNRASSVSRELKSKGIPGSRITTNGYGEEQPVADNGTTVGRSQNRRVEVAIFANNKLKRAAKENKQL